MDGGFLYKTKIKLLPAEVYQKSKFSLWLRVNNRLLRALQFLNLVLRDSYHPFFTVFFISLKKRPETQSITHRFFWNSCLLSARQARPQTPLWQFTGRRSQRVNGAFAPQTRGRSARRPLPHFLIRLGFASFGVCFQNCRGLPLPQCPCVRARNVHSRPPEENLVGVLKSQSNPKMLRSDLLRRWFSSSVRIVSRGNSGVGGNSIQDRQPPKRFSIGSIHGEDTW